MGRKLYLELYNGKLDPADAEFDDTLPIQILGPFHLYTITYGEIFRIIYEGEGYTIPMAASNDMLVYDGVFYADWSLSARLPKYENVETVRRTVPQAIEAGLIQEF